MLRSIDFNIRKLLIIQNEIFKASWTIQQFSTSSCLNTTTKHYSPRYKTLRGQKFIKIDLPDMQEKPEDLSLDQIRKKMKEKGVLAPRPWVEKQFEISSTGAVFEPYVPPEGDGKASIISKTGAKDAAIKVQKKGKTYLAIKKIRAFDEDFNSTDFATKEAQKIYIKVHEALMAKDEDALIQLVTEKAYPEVMVNLNRCTLKWKFVENIEPPRLLHARCTDIISKENIFSQVTVRFHSKQILAVYDRFGRLIHGSPLVAKDVLEYVVFEKHLANLYGIWRIHEKIIPDWAGVKEPQRSTFVLQEPPKEESIPAVVT